MNSIVNSPVSGSNFIQLSGGLAYSAGVTDFVALVPTPLTTGADGVSAPSFVSAVTSLFDQYCQMQILNLNLPGDVTYSDVNGVVTWAAAREDVFVVADGPVPSFPETSAQCTANYGTTMLATLGRSSFLAVYAPYLLIQDPASAVPGATRYIAPSGSVLGMYTAVDNLAGSNQAAAGVQYGQINCLDLEVRFARPT